MSWKFTNAILNCLTVSSHTVIRICEKTWHMESPVWHLQFTAMIENHKKNWKKKCVKEDIHSGWWNLSQQQILHPRSPGSQNTHSPQAVHIGLLAFYSEYSERALNQIFTWHKSSVLTQTFTPPIRQDWPAATHSCCWVHLNGRSPFGFRSMCFLASISVFDPDINCVGTKLSSLPLADVKTALITTRTCREITCWHVYVQTVSLIAASCCCNMMDYLLKQLLCGKYCETIWINIVN